MGKQELSVKGLALSFGIFLGVYMLLAALMAMWNVNTIWFNTKLFEILALVYPGISATWGGAILSLVYGVVDGAICGALLAWLYNKFA
ncbi:hypothetical protein HZA97_02985 [Candidatus Woesearchaeota archaeon]|nr:hypothetical protein [Candidatus Woesearchaeota archaeon]